MPQLYSNFHDSFIEKYLETSTGTIIGQKGEISVQGKNKSNYIFWMSDNISCFFSLIFFLDSDREG